ncbi:MAG: type II toxin-antitoxin system RelE/ParE family toxin [Gemmatimonadetes bacterium]|nr:type II toxin-antitoxin system RelE/ParE family toxin [Gemmatimonadota bacterium]
MIKSFRDRRTQELFLLRCSPGVPADLAWRAAKRLERIDRAHSVGDLQNPPGYRLHKLRGDRADQYSIAVNRQWRICFRFEDGDAYDVEFCDYH